MGHLPALAPAAIGRTPTPEVGPALGPASVPDDVGKVQFGDPLRQGAEDLRLTPADDRDVGARTPDHAAPLFRDRLVRSRLTYRSLTGEAPTAKKSRLTWSGSKGCGGRRRLGEDW
jgi:hypothetical protein